jgi:nicotinamidase-related amidase
MSRIHRDESVLVVVDVQERLFPHIYDNDLLERKIGTLIRGMKQLGVPRIVTEQYKKGLGDTIPSVKHALGDYQGIEKMTFSCCGEPNFNLALEEHFKKYVILCGIETHVCVMQTAIDLLDSGHIPVIVEDAVSSRSPLDKKVAIERVVHEGGKVATVESILFELCKVSGTAEFKEISALVK